MYSSRVLRSASRSSSSAFDGFLIPPRSTLDVFASAGNACLALLSSQGERDSFVAACNDGVINPPVIGQANFGVPMMLALYNDLNSPLFKKHGFVVEEFVEGAGPALEKFHEVQLALQEELHDDAGGGGDCDDGATAEGDGDGNSSTAEGREKVDFEASSSSKRPEGSADAEALLRSLRDLAEGNLPPGGSDRPDDDDDDDDADSMTASTRLMRRSWTKDAEADPDSLAAQLRAMVTGEYFDSIELSSKTSCLLEERNLDAFKAESGEITNMALLSARALELPPKTARDDDDDDGTPMTDDSLTDESLEDHPVAAQVEVLYDIEQTLRANEGDANAEESMKAQGLDIPRKSVLVGVFQGFLHKDPEGFDSIRWKLALNRPAWEFPYLFSG